MELQFYEDRLIIYRPARYYSDRLTREEVNIMPYAGITKCVYRSQMKEMIIYGDVDATWYDYGKAGRPSREPTHHRFVKDGMIMWSTRCTEVDFVHELEKHSSLCVDIEDI